jgi:hypothetical protein
MKFLASVFFYESTPYEPLIHTLEYFLILFEFSEIFNLKLF